MAVRSVAEAGHLAPSDGEASRKLRFVTLAVAAVTLLGGGAATVLEPQFGLLAAAIILGWTLLVGL